MGLRLPELADPRSDPKYWPDDATPADIARAFGREAVLALAGEVIDGKGSVRLAAAIALLERGYGKAPVTVHVSDDSSANTSKQLEALRKNPATAAALLALAEATMEADQ